MKRSEVTESLRPAMDALKAVSSIKCGGRDYGAGIYRNALAEAESVVIAALGMTHEQAREMLRGYRLPDDVAARVKAVEG